MTRRARAGAALIALLTGGLTACASAEYQAPSLCEARRWTLVLVRAGAEVGPEERALVEREARAALAGTRLLLPLPDAPPVGLLQDDGAWPETPPPRLLVEASRTHQADAVAVVGVWSFDPYPPARVELTLEVHSAETGALLYANSARFLGDAGDMSSLLLDPEALVATARHGAPPRRPARYLSRDAMARAACQELVAPLLD